MHILNLSRRNGRAQERILAAANALARFADLDPALIEALSPHVKDSAVQAMREREAVADLLEALAIQTGIPLIDPNAPAPDAVTVVTDPTPEPVSLPEPSESAQAESGDTLPPPVLEEAAPASEPAADDKSKSAKKRTGKK